MHQYLTYPLLFKNPEEPLGAMTGPAFFGAFFGAVLGMVLNLFAKRDGSNIESD